MTNFLFWNFNQPNQEEILASAVVAHDIDVVMLAECKTSASDLLDVLNRRGVHYHLPISLNPRFKILTKFSGRFLEPREDHPRMTVRRLCLPGRSDVLLAVIHFYDRRNYTPTEQHSLSLGLSAFLRAEEEAVGHRRTILVGDFNMHPFDYGMIDAKGFGAMMTKELARGSAGDLEKRQPRFYNPMWNMLGDMTEGPPGTFYHRANSPTNTYWHMLDQVLIRPDLLDAFQQGSLHILSRVSTLDGKIELIRRGKKHQRFVASDHLPIVFSMDL